MSRTNRYAMVVCNACADCCDHCATACLKEKDVAYMGRCIALDLDCAAICRLAAGYMGRSSEFTRPICEACAYLCDACAEECIKYPTQHCQLTAEACRKCADACRAM